jgi:hypothetical protein
MMRAIYIFFIILASISAVIAQEMDEKHLDIIFIIDASGSMHFTDPDEFRKVAVKAFIDITQDRGGDRIAVLQFAGWNETSSKGAELFPLTEVPADESKREKLLAKIKDTVSRKVTAFGKGTDFNFAFEKAAAQVLEKRKKEKTTNKAWVILLTDGTTDVKEGGNTRKEYLDDAGEEGLKSRKALNDAAQKYFAEKVLPEIAAEKDLFVTCISLTEDEPSPELKLLTEKAGAKVLRTTQQNLRGIFIEALTSLPEGAYRSDLTRGFGYGRQEAGPGGEAAAKFRIYQGTSVTRALIFAGSPEFTLDLKDPGGKSISDPQKIKLSGAGELYRVISITGCPPGEYTLTATNKSGKPVVFETLFFAQFNLKQNITVLNPNGKLFPGDKLEVELSLTENGKPITDKKLLEDMQFNFSLSLSRTSAIVGQTSFAFEKESRKTFQIEIPPETAPREYTVSASFRALKQTVSGEYAFAPPPVTVSFMVIEKPVIVAEIPKEPEPEPVPEPLEPPPAPPVEPEPEPVRAPEEVTGITGEATSRHTITPENAPGAMTYEYTWVPPWYVISIVTIIILIVTLFLLYIRQRPKGPALEFGDQQLWSAGGDARLLADLGEGTEIAGTPEIPDSIIFRLTGNPEAPKCQAKAGPEGKIYIDKQPVSDWVNLRHGSKIELEPVGRPDAPIYKYTYFERDPSPGERNKATGTVPKPERRDSTVKPEDIFPTDVLEKERLEKEKQKLPPPPDDDELIIYDDKNT